MFRLACYSGALLVVITVFVYTVLQTRLDKPQNKLYIMIAGIIFCNSVSEIVCTISIIYAADSAAAFNVLLIAQNIYFIAHSLLAPTLGYYVIAVVGKSEKYTKLQYLLYAMPYILCELICLSNPVLHWVFTYDENVQFHRGFAETAIYISSAAYLLYSLVTLFVSWNAITSIRRRSLGFFFLLIFIGIIIQLFFVNIKCELFFESLALFGIMLTIENEDSRIDVDTGIYNRSAFKMDLNSYIAGKQHFCVLCIKITNLETIQRVTGSVNTDSYIKMIGNFLKTKVHVYNIYHVNPMTYAITFLGSSIPNSENIAYEILERFESPWKLNDTEIILNAAAELAEIPSVLSKTEELIYLADTPAPAAAENTLLKGKDLNYLLRRIAVEHAIHRGIEENNFEVFYQPTYCLDGLRIHGAEALIRLHDPDLGNVFPDEFIPAAEQMGMIDDLDEFVLAEVCRFIKSGVPSEKGMDSINVNLSVIQCMRPGFVNRVLEIVDSIGADKAMINFEITESVSASDYRILSSVVKSLKSSGFMFSMDDYGTGYSNMQAIFSIDFDIVKIDKSILWGAEKSEMGMIILANSVNMIKQMKRKILVEGVETKEQIDLLAGFGVDYLQGYYFSKPVPKDKFLEVISV